MYFKEEEGLKIQKCLLTPALDLSGTWYHVLIPHGGEHLKQMIDKLIDRKLISNHFENQSFFGPISGHQM